MHLRSEALAKNWSSANLPILPFLAPRVFQAWPHSTRRCRKVHTIADGATATLHDDCTSDTFLHGVDSPTARGATPCRLRVCNGSRDCRGRTKKRHHHDIDGVFGSIKQDFGTQRSAGSSRVHQIPRAQFSKESVRASSLPVRLQRQNAWDAVQCGGLPRARFVPSPLQFRGFHTAVQPETVGLGSDFAESIDNQPRRTQFRAYIDSLSATPAAPVKNPLLGSQETRIIQQSLGILDEETLRKNWNRIGEEERLACWPHLVLKTLRYQPKHIRKWLAITTSDSVSGTYLDNLVTLFFPSRFDDASTPNVVQSLDKLDDVWFEAPDQPTEVTLDDIYGVVLEVLQTNSITQICILQKSIYTLLSHMSDTQLENFHHDLANLNHHLEPNTMLHFASRLAKKDANGVQEAMSILENLAEGGIDFDQPNIMSLCTTILHQSVEQSAEKFTVAARFQQLLDLGMKVNVIIYNVLVYNAVQTGDWETAWGIHDMMVESNIPPDVYTYSILLNDGKWRQDMPTITKVLDLVAEKNLQDNPYIVTDVLHLIFLKHQQQVDAEPWSNPSDEIDYSANDAEHGRNATCRKMLHKYAQHFNLKPLRRLIPNFETLFPEVRNSTSAKVHEPAVATLQVMLTSFLWSADAIQTKAAYENFLLSIKQRNSVGLELARSALIWSMFLEALGRTREHLNECPRLIKKMIALKSELEAESSTKNTQLPASSHIQRNQEPPIPDPNVYTWSILLNIFTKHNQLRAAEKITTAMQSRGTQPNEVTWTTLAWGYSRAQDVGKLADTVHRMELSGIRVGERAKVAMMGLADRQGFRKALSKLKDMQQ